MSTYRNNTSAEAKARMERYDALEKCRLTQEEKARWAPMLIDCWQGIAPDAMQAMRESGAKRILLGDLLDYVTCSIEPTNHGDSMTRDEYDFFVSVKRRSSGQKWLREVLGGYTGAL